MNYNITVNSLTFNRKLSLGKFNLPYLNQMFNMPVFGRKQIKCIALVRFSINYTLYIYYIYILYTCIIS